MIAELVGDRLEGEARDVVCDRAEELEKRLRPRRIEVDEDEPLPGVARDGGEVQTPPRFLVEVLFLGDVAELPGGVIDPAVETAREGPVTRSGGVADEPVPTVLADVVKGADLAVASARHQDRRPGGLDLDHEVIAGLFQLFDAADVEPAALEDFLALPRVVLG